MLLDKWTCVSTEPPHCGLTTVGCCCLLIVRLEECQNLTDFPMGATAKACFVAVTGWIRFITGKAQKVTHRNAAGLLVRDVHAAK
jgi:hypothetical protein